MKPAQPLVSHASTHVAPLGTYPASHLMAHALPSHVGWPCAVVAQGEHDAPQVAVAVLEEHVPVQSWNPLPQVLWHVPLEHVAAAFGRVGHTVHAAPQAVASVSDLHALPHAWNLVLHVALHVPLSQVTAPFVGCAQSAAVRQPSLHARAPVSQKRPALHSSFDVHPTLHELVERSQYDSVGQGHVFGRSMQAPLEQT